VTVVTSGLDGIDMENSYGCWASNCTVSGMADHQGYILNLASLRNEIRHCTIIGPGNTGGNDNYGYYTVSASGLLTEDNIAESYVGTPIMVVGASGCVYAYNVMTNVQNNSTGFMSAGILAHGGFPTMNLFEGNVAPNFGMDDTWGGGAYNTAFRNRFTGVPDAPYTDDGNGEAVQIDRAYHNHNVVGNVLGSTGVNTVYEDTCLTSCDDPNRVYYIGGSYGCVCPFGYDAVSYSTLFRACNWDSATGGIVSNGVAPSSLPASYYLSSAPAYFGTLAWPPVDPGNPAYSMSYTNIPAGYRLVTGSDPSSATTPPPAPSNLTLVAP
jgi:hypothetical protein